MAKSASFWTYQAGSDTPSIEDAIAAKAVHPDMTADDWTKLTPGMRREIVRTAKKVSA